MCSEQVSDLRAAAQDYKRDEDEKRKWALGPKYARGRGADAHPRPMRVNESFETRRRWEKQEAARLSSTGKAKLARKQDMTLAGQDLANLSEDSNTSEDDVEHETVAPDAGVMYSFDAFKSPSHGSQILNAALAKAIDKYEDKQTTKLVHSEYEVLDAQVDEEESLGLSPIKVKGRGKTNKVIDAEDEEYEFL
ncbi:hypothetical protein AAFC00_006768 [Neodothiora populina]|uniref:Uncharacterized protein n=1 Tax=Neodothiora populina TaxID=2781224 RepID=A0ABR3PB40_9PEZI